MTTIARRFLRATSFMAVVMAATMPCDAQDAITRASDLSFRVNVPAYRLDILEGSSIVRSYRIAIGTRRYRTPIREFRLSRIVWNPWWNPPESDWARDDTTTPPGPRNPMGKVKLMLDDEYFVHGTPQPRSIGQAASHGCIRMTNDDVIDLALFLHRRGVVPVDSATLDSLVKRWKPTRSFELVSAIPVHITYDLSEWYEAMLLLHPDVYRRHTGDERVTQTLRVVDEAGYDSLGVDRDKLARLLTQARTRRVRVPIDSVLTILIP
jgi:murein L,D-transpeptidase YcbB/YkuD